MILHRPWNGVRGFLNDARSTLRGNSLGAQMLRGGAWTLGLRVATQLASLAQVFVVARLLAPGDVGLMGIAMLTIGILDLLTEGGLSVAATQRRGDVTPYLNTMFTVQLVRSGVTALGLLLLAPALAGFFHNPAAADVIRAMAAFVVARGLANPGMVLFTRALAFGPSSRVALVGLVAALVTTIPLAFLLQNVWALLLGAIVSQAAMTVATYVVSPYRPRPELEWGRLRDLTRFGKWVSASGIVYFVLLNADDVLVGRVLGTASLGLYQFAFRVSNLPATEITRTLFQVSFPAYAAIQHDRERLRQTYLQVLRATTLISLPAAAVLLAAAPDLIAGVLGSQWLPALGAFQMLCLYGASRSIIATTGPLFQAADRPSIPLWLALAQLAALAPVAYPVTQRWGLVGMATAVGIANVLALGVAMALVARLATAPPRDLGSVLWPGVRAAGLVGAAVLAIRVLVEAPPLVRLALEVGAVGLLSPIVILPLVRGWKSSSSRLLGS